MGTFKILRVIFCKKLTLFLGGVDLARRRDVGRFHLKVRLEVYPESYFFWRGKRGFLCQRVLLRDGRMSFIRPVDGFQCPCLS